MLKDFLKLKKFLLVIVALEVYWSSIAIFINSFSYAFEGIISFLSLLLAFFICIPIFILSKLFNKKFTGPLKYLDINKTKIDFFRFTLSFSLSYYISLIVFGGIDCVKDVLINPTCEYITTWMIVMPFFGVFILMFMLVPIYILIKIVVNRGLIIKLVAVIVYIFIWLIYLYFMLFKGTSLPIDKTINTVVNNIMPLIAFVIGSLPLGWINELYFQSMLSRVNTNLNLPSKYK